MNRKAWHLFMVAALLIKATSYLTSAAEENPFTRAARESYIGRFHGQGIELRLVPDETNWRGTLLFQARNYTVKAELKATGLEGMFSQDNQTWPFGAVADGDSITFTAGSFSAVLHRRAFPKMLGRWRSHRVLVIFDSDSDPSRKGRIEFDGRGFAFTASETAGDLEGEFRTKDQSFPFRIANEERGLVFHTETFNEVLEPVPNISRLHIQTQPPVPFALLNEGRPVENHEGWFEFGAEKSLKLELQAEGYKTVLTNFLLPDYTNVTWIVPLVEIPYPTARSARWTNSLGMVFVPITGTKVLFSIWDTRVQDFEAYAAAVPGLDDSWREVRFQGLRVSGGLEHPVTMVGWATARSFCRWLTETEQRAGRLALGQSYRLPTDAEWSKAVGLSGEREGLPADKDSKIKMYPWGKNWPPSGGAGNFADRTAHVAFKSLPALTDYDDGFATTSPVGSFSSNQFGLFDMAGNVWQWCEDAYDRSGKSHVVRGGSWRTGDARSLLSSHRLPTPDGRDSNLGFRCLLELNEH